MPDGTKPLPEPMLTCNLEVHEVTFIWEQVHKKYFSQQKKKKNQISLKITYLKFQSNLPGTKEIIKWTDVRLIYWKEKADILQTILPNAFSWIKFFVFWVIENLIEVCFLGFNCHLVIIVSGNGLS